MDNDEPEEYPIEHIIALYAANFKLKGQRFNLEELIFLHEVTKEAINGREHEAFRASGTKLH